MALLLRKTRELEMQVDEYFDMLLKGALVFREGMKSYMENNQEEFEHHRVQLDDFETKADSIRRSVESRLYLETLIPDMRGDVLGLLESSDKVLNQSADTLNQFAVEIPMIPESLKPMFLDLAEASAAAVEAMVLAIRVYFREPEKVRDQIIKTMFYEKESDHIGDKIKRLAFRTDIRLSHKIHIRYFTYHIELIADLAEDVCDRLAIAAIKRSL